VGNEFPAGGPKGDGVRDQENIGKGEGKKTFGTKGRGVSPRGGKKGNRKCPDTGEGGEIQTRRVGQFENEKLGP